MAVEYFEINLEYDIDEQYQYQPGEVVRGHVLLKLTEPVKVKAIQVQVKGESTVSWKDEASGSSDPFRAEEMYVNETQNLLVAKGEDSIELKPGKHRFPLEYILPDNLPSSFIGTYGSITYVVRATLKEDKKFSMNTLITSEPFLVLRKLDLTQNEDLSKRIDRTTKERFFGALVFCVSGKITMNVGINKPGLLPGEDIFMDAEIINDSPRVVHAVQAAIIMHSTFYAKNNTKYNSQVVSKKRDEWEMMMGEGRRWRGVRLTIPPYIPESRLDCCDIIDIRYELVYTIDISGNNKMKVTIPITIGTSHKTDGLVGSAVFSDDEYSTIGGVDANSNKNADGEQQQPDDFRYPMAPDGTRHNPLFSTISVDHSKDNNIDNGVDDDNVHLDDASEKL